MDTQGFIWGGWVVGWVWPRFTTHHKHAHRCTSYIFINTLLQFIANGIPSNYVCTMSLSFIWQVRKSEIICLNFSLLAKEKFLSCTHGEKWGLAGQTVYSYKTINFSIGHEEFSLTPSY